MKKTFAIVAVCMLVVVAAIGISIADESATSSTSSAPVMKNISSASPVMTNMSSTK